MREIWDTQIEEARKPTEKIVEYMATENAASHAIADVYIEIPQDSAISDKLLSRLFCASGLFGSAITRIFDRR
jgi:hypothetical protein